ncbi:MAG TPA: type IV pilus secretin PilQ [Steroidobacteraceae bacterium]|nr:type IV pilus secretin PilQ [Steroidobacteraceae bacterium]
MSGMNRLWLALGAGIRSVLGAALLAAFATAAALPGLAAAQPSAPLKLEAIDVQTLPGHQLQLRLRLNGPAPQPLSFTIDKPARIALDLPNTALGLQNRRIDVKSGGVDTILAAEAGGRTRLVVNLDSLMPYDTRVDGNNILVMIGGSQAASAAAAPAAAGGAAAASPSRSSSMAANGPRSIRGIDFRRAPDGGGRVIVDLSDPHTPVNLRQQGTQIVVDFAGASLPTELMKRFDVTDFATPVQNVDALKVSDSSRLVISAIGDFEQLAYQTDNQYTVEIKPVVRTAAAADERKEYTGERLTLNFQDIETRAVLQLLADTSGQNIVVSDSVQGNVTLRLQNVPWDQALDIVLRTKGLDKRREGNVIIVAPTEELAAREKAQLAARKDLQELSPLRTEYVQVNYAKAADLAGLIKASSGNNSLLSARGSVTIDERTNTLLVQDTADRLQDIRRLVSTLDIPIRQVLIEARIVIANDDFSRNLGVRFGATAIGDQQSLGFGGTNSAGVISSTGVGRDDDQIVLQPNNNNAPGGTPPSVSLPAVNNRYMVNLPVANPAGRFALTLLDSDFIVDLELSAAQAEGRGEIVSAPRVVTANQREAVIEQGQEIPYQEASSSGATTIQFKKAVLALRVTPQITPDNRIIMDLTVSKDSVGQVIVTSAGVNVPSIDTREIVTQVLVNDGQTVVLGGIMETEFRETETKVPWLGDIPGLGILFKNKSKTNNKDELLIFITPRILREGANLY